MSKTISSNSEQKCWFMRFLLWIGDLIAGFFLGIKNLILWIIANIKDIINWLALNFFKGWAYFLLTILVFGLFVLLMAYAFTVLRAGGFFEIFCPANESLKECFDF